MLNFNREEKLSMEDSARVDQAIDELSEWYLPQVWIGDPNWDENGNPFGPRINWLELTRYIEKDLVPHIEQVQLFEETLHVLAARRKLVTVKEVLLLEQFTPTQKLLSFSVRNQTQRAIRNFVVSKANPLGSGFYEEHLIEEDTMIMFESPPTTSSGSITIIRFVDRDVLLPCELPYVNDFFHTALYGPCDVVVQATSELLFIADVLADIEYLGTANT